MRPILVTGATGFLGKHLVEQLKIAEPDAPLRLLCRGPSPWDADPRVEITRGDITSRSDVRHAMAGTGQVYHLAGVVTRDPYDKGVYRTHVDGTRNICEAAH